MGGNAIDDNAQYRAWISRIKHLYLLLLLLLCYFSGKEVLSHKMDRHICNNVVKESCAEFFFFIDVITVVVGGGNKQRYLNRDRCWRAYYC